MGTVTPSSLSLSTVVILLHHLLPVALPSLPEAEGFWDASLSVFKLGLSWGKPGRVGHSTPLLGCNFHEGGDHLGPAHYPSPFDT